MVISLGVAALRGLFSDESGAAVRCMAICDGLFVAGILLGGSGVLIFCRNRGAFDSLFFTLKMLFRLRWPYLGGGSYTQDYAQYRAERQNARSGAGPLLLAGCIYLAASLPALAAFFAFSCI